MTDDQKKSARILLPFTISLLMFWFFDGKEEVKKVPALTSVSPGEKAAKPAFRGPASVPQVSVSSPQNAVASLPAWRKEFEKNLRLQGGSNLKNIDVEKVDSFEWKMGHVPVKVDSLIVKLEHVKGYRSSFRAIVDSSNGKILQTWDHPVNDNFDPKTKAGIKIDPRYHND